MNTERLISNRLARSVYFALKGRFREKALRGKIERTFQSFHVDRSAFPDEEELIRDMLRMYRRYGYGFGEYLYFHFYELGMAERRSFVPDWERRGYTAALNDPANDRLFEDKWQTYCRFRPYYGRELLFCGPDTPAEGAFAAFVQAHPRFIAKPPAGSSGKGVRCLDAAAYGTPQALKSALLARYPGGCVLEEPIVQAPEMAAFHPASVNTVRIPTVRMEKEVRILPPFIRFGQRGSLVDNAGAGGIMGGVDAETGRILASVDVCGQAYPIQPDTGEPIVGFTIPRWKEAVALVKELAQVVPGNRYTGWDCALTEKGWVLVEANRSGQFAWQIPLRQGCRAEMDGILAELGIKY